MAGRASARVWASSATPRRGWKRPNIAAQSEPCPNEWNNFDYGRDRQYAPGAAGKPKTFTGRTNQVCAFLYQSQPKPEYIFQPQYGFWYARDHSFELGRTTLI